MKLKSLKTSVYRVPTDHPEADGTIAWDSTTMVLVEATADSGLGGIGFSYTSGAAAQVVHEVLEPHLLGLPIEDIGAAWRAMVAAVRNLGRQGIAASAISAVDVALWDLKARSLGLPLFKLLGAVRDEVPIYGSGGFTTYPDELLREQLGGWVKDGISRVKMKIGQDWGTNEARDIERVRVAREAIGSAAELFVDANGAYGLKQALRLARVFAESGVTYFEEPVSSDQLDQLALIRANTDLDIAAGEYGYDPWYFRTMLERGAVDILQADATRCLGITGWLEAAQLAHAFAIPFSAHTSPSIHAQAGCAAPQLSHVEYFHDHARIEEMFFDGVPERRGGYLRPHASRGGLGLELKKSNAEAYKCA
ncbi:MAG: enolase C-terminal domain-like protein [Candidatus Dormibacteria bacterium]